MDPVQFLFGGLFGILVAIVSYAVKFLTKTGAVATFFLALIVYGSGGWAWTVPIVTFFVTSSLLSKVGRAKKNQYAESFEKTGARDWAQVLANGGVAGVVALLSNFLPAGQLYPLYLGSIAAAAADTWGTEIGVLSNGAVFSIANLKPVPPGTSGGMTIIGTVAGALGAAVVAFSGYAWYSDLRIALLVMGAGIVGSLADSLIGATLQARFRCPVCGHETERPVHCATPTEHVGGVRWMGNDAINLVCTLVGAIAVWVMLALI